MPGASFLTGHALKQADALVVHSRSDQTIAAGITLGKNIFRADLPLFNAFPDTKLDRLSIKQKFTIPTDRPVLLFFGYVRKYKGLSVLLESMTYFPAETSPFLLVVGEFYDSLDEYRRFVAKNNLEDRVRLVPGYVRNEDVALYFRLAEAVVLPYLSASQSGICQIARSFDCPVVASRVGGLPDMIDSPRNGILVEPNDAEHLFQALRTVMVPAHNQRIREEMRREATRYSWSVLARTYETIYRHLIDQ